MEGPLPPHSATPSTGPSVWSRAAGGWELAASDGHRSTVTEMWKGRGGWERTRKSMSSAGAKSSRASAGANLEPEPGTGTDSLHLCAQEQNDGTLAASGGRGVTPNVEECIRHDK